MATPDFVLDLRKHIGHSPLWLMGVTAVVVHDGRILLGQRADNGQWTPVTGIVDPGEEPAAAAVREVAEETGTQARPLRLASIGVTRPITYGNGDQCQFLDHTFLMEWLGGEPYPADGENSQARWFGWDDRPPMSPEMEQRIAAATSGETSARFGIEPLWKRLETDNPPQS